MGPKRKSKARAGSAGAAKRAANSGGDDDAGQVKRAKGAAADAASATGAVSHWLIKSEPESRMEKGVDVKFGLEDLKREPEQTSCWDGVRNYQARNNLRAMRVGHQAFFYHSNCKSPGVAGLVRVVREAYPDHTQFDPKDPHYDPKSDRADPRWSMVDVKYVRDLKRYITLKELKDLHLAHKSTGGPLAKLALFTSARLSVQPISKEEFDFIIALEEKDID